MATVIGIRKITHLLPPKISEKKDFIDPPADAS
jgi:hypothetical protein